MATHSVGANINLLEVLPPAIVYETLERRFYNNLKDLYNLSYSISYGIGYVGLFLIY